MPKENEVGKALRKAVGVHARKVWDTVFQNVMLSILASIGVVAGGVLLAFKEWSFAGHTLTLPGWLWVLLSVLYPVLFGVGILLDVRWPLKYKEEADVKNRLSIYFRRVAHDPFHYTECTLHYRWFDRKYRLKRGSAKKYLAEVAKEYGWDIIQAGPGTLRVCYRPVDEDDNQLS